MSETILGIVDRIVFSTEDGYAVIKVKVNSDLQLIFATGLISSLQPGEEVRLNGNWNVHPKYGQQFQVDHFESTLPKEANAICIYLASSNIEGIGPVFARRIVDTFKEKTLDILDENLELLFKVPGIGKKRIEKIAAKWQEHKFIRSLMLFLAKHAIKPSIAWKIFKTYGEFAQEKIEENPYVLAKDVFGVGFKSADDIAFKLGIEKTSDKRIQAGIEYLLWQEANFGNTCISKVDLLSKSKELLAVEETVIHENIQKLIEIEALIEKQEIIWPVQLYRIEEQIAFKLFELMTNETQLRSFDENKAIKWLQNQLTLKLAEKQLEAVQKSLQEKLLIITGGPGTGKSTIIKAILLLFEKLTNRILLAAPTGKAAKRMAQITRKKAFTIHALLEYDFTLKGFKKDKDNPLHCDLIIIDEASMIDTFLMRSLILAIPKNAKLIFVGDIDQLPSVGPGNVLKDLIESQLLPTIRLNKIFRQARMSRIILSAHRVNEGEFPLLDNNPEGDFFFIEQEDPQMIVEEISELVVHRLPQKGFDPLKDIQVLTPMKKGVVGSYNLNIELQKKLTNKGLSYEAFGKKFCINDRVMQMRNNYDLNLFNGEVGLIIDVQIDERLLVIDFEKKIVQYPFSQLADLMLAYAVSIHKFQGSECPVVLVPLHISHFKLLTRNLIYTAITRAKKLFILIGSKKAIGLAVANKEVQKRLTGLKDRLQERMYAQTT